MWPFKKKETREEYWTGKQYFVARLDESNGKFVVSGTLADMICDEGASMTDEALIFFRRLSAAIEAEKDVKEIITHV